MSDNKTRTSITISEEALKKAKARAKALGYSSVSELMEALVLQDALEKRTHTIVREEGNVIYRSSKQSPGKDS